MLILCDSCIREMDLITIIYPRALMKVPKDRDEGVEPKVRGIIFA